MSRFATFTVVGLLLAVPLLPAQAQKRTADATPKKLYCWNKGSERICSDALPQEAVNSAREEFNLRSGMRSGEVQRALTDEERAEQQRLDLAAEQTRQRTEQAMLATYESEDDLRRVFAERSGILDNNIHTASYNVASVRDSLVTLLASAGNRELDGQPVPDKQAERIRERHAELVAQRRMQASFEQQRRALDVEIESTLQRYRLLKGVGSDPRG